VRGPLLRRSAPAFVAGIAVVLGVLAAPASPFRPVTVDAPSRAVEATTATDAAPATLATPRDVDRNQTARTAPWGGPFTLAAGVLLAALAVAFVARGAGSRRIGGRRRWPDSARSPPLVPA
jgi:hypothetical protein